MSNSINKFSNYNKSVNTMFSYKKNVYSLKDVLIKSLYTYLKLVFYFLCHANYLFVYKKTYSRFIRISCKKSSIP